MKAVKQISIGTDTYNIQDVGLRELLNGKSTFAGIATPDLDPGTPTSSIFYIANEYGSYSNFGGVFVDSGESAIIEWNPSNSNTWVKHTISKSGVVNLGPMDDNEAFSYLADPANLMTLVNRTGTVQFDKPMMFTWYDGSNSNLAISITGSQMIMQFLFGRGDNIADNIKYRYISWSMKTVSGGTVPYATNVSSWTDYSVTKSRAGFMTPDMFNTLNNISGALGGSAQVVEWGDSSNVNSYTAAGVYRLAGTRYNLNDGLPVENIGGGNTIDAMLQVFDSSLISGATGKDTDACVTQVLTLSNRVGGDGNVYTRTGRGINKYSLVWENWSKLQTNIEVGQVNSLDSFVDNGIYSGVLTDGTTSAVGTFYDTFVMVVINNYAVSDPLGQTRSISQFKYSLGLDGVVNFQYRVGTGGDTITWQSWRKTLLDSIYGGTDEKNSLLSVDGYGATLLLGSGSSLVGMLRTSPSDNMSSGDLVTFSNVLTNNSVTFNNVKMGSDLKMSLCGSYGNNKSKCTFIGTGTINFAGRSYLSIGTGVIAGETNYVRFGTGVNVGGSTNIGVGVNIVQDLTISTALDSNQKMVLKFVYKHNGVNKTTSLVLS